MNEDGIRFGPFVLDVAAQRLWRAGKEVRLRQKSWKTLCYLAERPGSLVSADELLAEVWSGRAVSPASLPTVVWELRKTLACDESPDGFIDTISRRGYVFTIPESFQVGASHPGDHRLEYLERAAADATKGFAYADAAAYLFEAAHSLRRQPASTDRHRRESEIWLDYANMVAMGAGVGDPRVWDAYVEALHKARMASAAEAELRARLGQCFWLSFNLDARAGECARDLLEFGRRAGVAGWLPVIHLYVSIARTFAGSLEEAIQLLEDVEDVEPGAGIPREWDLPLGFSIHKASLSSLLGRRTALKRQASRTLARADQLGTPYARMMALTYCAAQFGWVGLWSAAERYADEAASIAAELDNPSFVAITGIILARSRVEKGIVEPDQLNDALQARAALGEAWWTSCHGGWLAECRLAAGDTEGALAAVEAALAVPELQFRSDVLRIKGDVLLAMERTEDGLDCYRKALEIARSQGARVYAKRAAERIAAAS